MLVNAPVHFWRPSIAWALFVSLAIVAAPLPCLAGDSSPTTSKPVPTLKSSIEHVAATHVLATSAPAARAQEQGKTDLGSKSFFRTPGGIIALVALGAGVGFALYSTSHDRVKSPAR